MTDAGKCPVRPEHTQVLPSATWLSRSGTPYFKRPKSFVNKGLFIKLRRLLGGLGTATALALGSVWAADLPVISAVYSGDGSPSEVALAAYRAMSASRSRNYDRAQDISPRQMMILLEVSQRTEASLGQLLATGEMESAYTWNDHVRPTLKNGNLGSATGVWQFQPATFHDIVKTFGARLLAASESDALTGRAHMDLGDDPFTDAQVRSLIQETVDDKRDAEDGELQLLRHNFAVLTFAKHYLSVQSGATTPEEDYLYHFLGAGRGRQVLALARGEARDTLCVKPMEAPVPPIETLPELLAENPAPPTAQAALAARAAFRLTSPITGSPDFVYRVGPDARPAIPSRRGLRSQLEQPPALDRVIATRKAQVVLRTLPPVASESAVWFPVDPDPLPPVSSDWGLPANSPIVTGNLGMFYRDGRGQSQPYTWAEFMEHLARRVRAQDQPALVRAKYGVGFGLKGGDLPERFFYPEKVSEAAEFRYESGRTVLVPDAMVTGPLGRDETQQYQERLAGLVRQGEDKPLDTLPPEALSALHHLRMLPENLQAVSTSNTEVQKALHNFRKTVGKEEPDDPAHFNLLMPVERIALEIYDQRLARYAQLQAGQLASFGVAPDLNRVRQMPAGLQRAAAPEIASVQTALAAQQLLTQPTQKSVWRDKKRKKHVDYKTVPFAGKADKATIAALDTFQLRNGLRKTGGILDAVTLNMLNLPPMGPEIFLPLSGPQCVIDRDAGTVPMCAILTDQTRSDPGNFSPIQPRVNTPWNWFGFWRLTDAAHLPGSMMLRAQQTRAESPVAEAQH